MEIPQENRHAHARPPQTTTLSTRSVAKSLTPLGQDRAALPPRPSPLGCHNTRVDDRKPGCLFLVLRPGCNGTP